MQAQRVVHCHVHVFDPQRFPYRPDTFYVPAGQELGTPARLRTVLAAHGVEHALLVGPNSGYGEEDRLAARHTLAAAGRAATAGWPCGRRTPSRGPSSPSCGRPGVLGVDD